MKTKQNLGIILLSLMVLTACGKQSQTQAVTAAPPAAQTNTTTGQKVNVSTQTAAITDMSKLPAKPDCSQFELDGKWIEAPAQVPAGTEPSVSYSLMQKVKEMPDHYHGKNVYKKARNCQNFVVSQFNVGFDRQRCIINQVETNHYYVNRNVNPPAGPLEVSTTPQYFYIATVTAAPLGDISEARLIPCEDAECKILKIENSFIFKRNGLHKLSDDLLDKNQAS